MVATTKLRSNRRRSGRRTTGRLPREAPCLAAAPAQEITATLIEPPGVEPRVELLPATGFAFRVRRRDYPIVAVALQMAGFALRGYRPCPREMFDVIELAGEPLGPARCRL